MQEMEEIQKRSSLAEATGYYVATQRNIKSNGVTFENRLLSVHRTNTTK